MNELKWYNISRSVKLKDVIPSRTKRVVLLSLLLLGWGNFLAFWIAVASFGGAAQEGLMSGDWSMGRMYLVTERHDIQRYS